ncbi:Synaptic vesicular amine transporter [Taenia crassiceps]|uniref:Synaptic vesicular amine transporter n=1 Tax=Taenia crassiceps TaxID=6207 RepID=A0ABR4QM59_9CEST
MADKAPLRAKPWISPTNTANGFSLGNLVAALSSWTLAPLCRLACSESAVPRTPLNCAGEGVHECTSAPPHAIMGHVAATIFKFSFNTSHCSQIVDPNPLEISFFGPNATFINITEKNLIAEATGMSHLSKENKGTCTKRFYESLRDVFSRRGLVLIIVTIALFLDNMLLTTVVPIVPNFLLTTKAHHLVNTILDTTTYNCTSKALLKSTLSEAVLSLIPVAWASRAHVVLSMDDFLDPSRASKEEKMRVQKLLDRINTLASDCNLNVTKLAIQMRQSHMERENFRVGMLFASKSIVQLVVNPFVGPLTNRIGYSIPMFTGFLIMFCSTIVFAFGESYTVLLIARAIQGAGSACSSVSGMGTIATFYTDSKERTRAFGTALSGLALGVLVGPTFGGIVYQFVDKRAPFLMLAVLALLDGVLQIVILKPSIRPEQERGAPIVRLLRDPYILVAAGALTFGNIGIAILEPALPMWMKEHMNADNWAQGIAFLPASVSYLLGTNIFGIVAHRIGHCKRLGHLIVPTFGLGLSMGMVDASMMPQMGILVDLRHVAVYGSVYAIADVAFCLGFAFGPAVGGCVAQSAGFSWTIWGIAIVSALYSPLLIFLRNPPSRGEIQPLTGGKEQAPNIAKKGNTEDFALGGALGYDPTEGGQKAYDYGVD